MVKGNRPAYSLGKVRNYPVVNIQQPCGVFRGRLIHRLVVACIT